MSEEQEQRNDAALRELLDNIEDGEHPFGIITQAGYRELQEQIHTWIVRGLIGFAVIGLACAVSLVGFGILLTKQGNTTNSIQEQRYNAFLDSCLDTNDRHDKVIAKIDAAVANTPKDQQDPKGVTAFKLILEAAVPFTEDCAGYAKSRVEGEGK